METNYNSITLCGREYVVSSDGNIYTSSGKALSKHIRKGYEYIAVSLNGKRIKYSVHRVVCKAFHDNPNKFNQVNHIDGNKLNNASENLEWVNSSLNQMHSRYVLGNHTGFNDVPVRCIETNEIYISTRDAWRTTGVNYSHISECINGKRKSAGGLHWESIGKEVV